VASTANTLDVAPGSAEDMKTVADLSAEASKASERVHTLMIMNTPTDYEDRKKAFIELALAREVAAKALIALTLASSRGW